jgi:hypothetical protein
MLIVAQLVNKFFTSMNSPILIFILKIYEYFGLCEQRDSSLKLTKVQDIFNIIFHPHLHGTSYKRGATRCQAMNTVFISTSIVGAYICKFHPLTGPEGPEGE